MKKNANLSSSLDQFQAYGLSNQAQYQCIGGGNDEEKMIQSGVNGLGQSYLTIGKGDTKGIVNAGGSSGLQAGIQHKGYSLTTEPFSNAPNVAIQGKVPCFLF